MVKPPPVASTLAAAGSSAAAWSDAAFAPRKRARDAVCSRTGYSSAAVDRALDRLFEPLTAAALGATIAAELGTLGVLDGFVERPGVGRVRALPLGRVCVISSRTTVGVALIPAIFALCANCDVLVKDREDGLVAAFFDTLAETLPALRERMRARAWRGDDDAIDLHGFDGVVAFGSDATLERISALLPFSRTFVAYPNKTSAGYVAREDLCDETAAAAIARAAAHDALLYDGEGCLSLHLLFVERGARVTPERFGQLLGRAFDDAARTDAALRSASGGAARAMARDLAAFRGSSTTYADPQCSYLVTVDPPEHVDPLLLPRTLMLRSVDAPAGAQAYLTRHGLRIEGLAASSAGEALRTLAAAAGASRIARFGRLQAPPLAGFHGGRPRIAEFVRWTVDET
jgi:hypothetical protein